MPIALPVTRRKKPSARQIRWPRGTRLFIYDSDFFLIDKSRDLRFDLVDNLLTPEVPPKLYVGVEIHSRAWPRWDAESLKWVEDRIRWDLDFDGVEVRLQRRTRAKRRPCTEEFIWKLEAY